MRVEPGTGRVALAGSHGTPRCSNKSDRPRTIAASGDRVLPPGPDPGPGWKISGVANQERLRQKEKLNGEGQRELETPLHIREHGVHGPLHLPEHAQGTLAEERT